jgi:hypothetical protein
MISRMRPAFVLVHSPSVGPSTWRPVADQLTQAGDPQMHRFVRKLTAALGL